MGNFLSEREPEEAPWRERSRYVPALGYPEPFTAGPARIPGAPGA